MSDYGKIITTNSGRNMLLESIKTKTPVIFTKISIGDGVLSNESIETLTQLKHSLLDGGVPQVNTLGNGEIEAISTIDNSNVTIGFFARELGLFAKLGDEGKEQLFAYTNAGSNASYIPPNTSIDEKMMGIQLAVGDANVTVNAKSHMYITNEQLESEITKHNTDTSAHDNRFKALEQTTQSLTSKVNGTLDKKYDKTGGVLSGDIILTGESGIKRDNNSYYLSISSSNRDDGANIGLVSGEFSDEDKAGAFLIEAKNNSTSKSLVGKPDGTLKWDDDEIIRQSMLAKTDTTSSLSQAPTLQLVKSLLSGLNIKSGQDVLQALGTETLQSLGVKYDFSNEKAWYICLGKLFGGLIIQGGIFSGAIPFPHTRSFTKLWECYSSLFFYCFDIIPFQNNNSFYKFRVFRPKYIVDLSVYF
nr:hypothetical protein [Veillonella montpellierensis]